MPLFIQTLEGTYTPTATGLTLSTGTISGTYWRTDRDTKVKIVYTFGTGDTFTGSGNPFVFTLPFAATAALNPSQINGWVEDTGAGTFPVVVGPGNAADTTHTPGIWQAGLVTAPTPDTLGISNWSTSQPMSWVAGDRLVLMVIGYPAAG